MAETLYAKPSTRENDAVNRYSKDPIYGALTCIAQYTVCSKLFLLAE